ncbi:MAG: amidohydrolase family protein [Clostridia bacterium]|nr:amidohydrolase family protein [Clostridia bacterium]
MVKIDAHNHPDYHGRNYARFLADMDEKGISKTWLLTWECPPGEYDPATIWAFATAMGDRDVPVPLRLAWEYKERAPERFILGYCPDPRRPDAVQKMRAAIRTYGVQVCGELKLRMMYDNPDALDLYRFCGEEKIPVVMHFDNAGAQTTGKEFPRRHWWYGGDIDTLERVLALCPETNFLGHAPGFWCHISRDRLGEREAYPKGPVVPGGRIEELLGKYPNLYCDCSAGSCLNALTRDPAYTKRLILRHPDRFVYARDYFDNELSGFIDGLGLPQEVLEAFYHGNAERLAGAEFTLQ